MIRLTGVDLSLCPECGKGKMVYIEGLTKTYYGIHPDCCSVEDLKLLPKIEFQITQERCANFWPIQLRNYYV